MGRNGLHSMDGAMARPWNRVVARMVMLPMRRERERAIYCIGSPSPLQMCQEMFPWLMTMAATSGVDVVRVDDGGCHAWLAAGGFGRRRRCGCSRRSWLLGSGRVLLTLTSGCCRADGVGESDDDGSDERCRCSTGRRWGLPRVAGSWRLRTQATL